MKWRTGTIMGYYPMALSEGEGLGTAYEYLAKERVLRPFLEATPPGASVLVAGLPERYGTSLDFVRLAARIGADVVVEDERRERLDTLRSLVSALPNADRPPRIEYTRVDSPEAIGREGGLFDLTLACEVLQRVSIDERSAYISSLCRRSRRVAVFAPNGDNPEHASRSGLAAVTLKEMLGAAQGAGMVIRAGYVDMPPFPPGVVRSEAQRGSVAQSRSQRILVQGLEGWCRAEALFPRFVRMRCSHIVYVLLENDGKRKSEE